MIECTNKVMTDLVLLVSKTGHYQEFESGAISDLLAQQGYKPQLNMIFPENIVVRVLEAVVAALEIGSVHMVDYSLDIGLKEEYFEAKAIPLHTKYVLLLIQNVTDHVENRKAIHQHSTLLQTVIDTVPSKITAFDKHGNITILNKAAFVHDSGNSADLTGDTLNLKADGKTEYQVEELPLTKAFNGKAIYDQIVIKKHETSSPKTYLVNAVPIRNGRGEFNGVVQTERDITDIKTIQLKLKSAIKDLDMFVYRASHDLKSPLASMEGVLNVAFETTSESNLLMYLEMIRKSHRLLSSTVNDLISLTQVSQKEVKKVAIKLHPLIKDITDTLCLLPQAAGIKVKVCMQESMSVFADEGLLRTVLQNLICNAIIHHRAKGEDRFVLITLLNQPRKILIEITDNGQGIGRNIQDKIYDMFYRGNVNTTGSGLGLFIVKQAIEKMDATIELVSDEEIGATFCIALPNNVAKCKAEY